MEGQTTVTEEVGKWLTLDVLKVEQPGSVGR